MYPKIKIQFEDESLGYNIQLLKFFLQVECLYSWSFKIWKFM